MLVWANHWFSYLAKNNKDNNFSQNRSQCATRTTPIGMISNLNCKITFPRHIWQEIGRVMDREVDETDTFLLAINACHVIQSVCSICHDRSFLPTTQNSTAVVYNHAQWSTQPKMAADSIRDCMEQWWLRIVLFSVILKSLLMQT